MLTEYCSGDEIEKNEMGGACSTFGVVGMQGFSGATLAKETTWKTQT